MHAISGVLGFWGFQTQKFSYTVYIMLACMVFLMLVS